jgi:hypothetical protein
MRADVLLAEMLNKSSDSCDGMRNVATTDGLAQGHRMPSRHRSTDVNSSAHEWDCVVVSI